jgi:hypothetical protein
VFVRERLTLNEYSEFPPPATVIGATGQDVIMTVSLLRLLLALLSLAVLHVIGAPAMARAADAADTAASRSPANQIFQWAVTATCSEWPDASQSTATGYLWIPEDCERLRGLLILGTNVPEHMLVGHPAIRSACVEKNLGIVWFVPTFWNFRKFPEQTEASEKAGPEAKAALQRQLQDIHARFLQTMLEGLARVSGYDEVAAVPWLPMGESGHLLMVTGLVDARPDHCIAAICIKNPQGPKDRTVPMLWTFGTAQEWGQSQTDVRTAWQNVTGMYEGWSRGRAGSAWPLSLAIEPSTGHFYCTDAMTELFGHFIRAAADSRLPPDGGNTLAPVDLDTGVVAELPVPGHEAAAITPYRQATAEEKQRPWFFNETTARMAQRLAVEDWTGATRLPGFEAVAGCTVKPFSLNAVTDVDVESDGEFIVRGIVRDRIPDGFLGAGEPLATDRGPPTIEWICGPIVPLGDGRFQVAPDRTYPFTTSYIAAVLDGAKGLRRSLQPARVKPRENRDGSAQAITFEALPDIPEGTRDLPLVAASSAGLPVRFYVETGPAVVEGDRLVLTRIPPRAAYPVRVSVAAWQWGRHSEPQVQAAPIVRRSFTIVKAAAGSR